MKTFISQNINKIKLALFPESIVLVATCTYHKGNDEFHAILQLAKPTDLDSSGNYNTLTAVAAPYDVNVIEEIRRSWDIFGYPIAFNTTEFPDSEFRNFLFTGDSVIQELDTPVDLFNGTNSLNGNTKNSSLATFAFLTFMENKYPEGSIITPADWDQWIGESDLMIRAGSSTCHFVISDASSYTCIQNLMIYSNEGFFMVFTESASLDKLFARDIATLNDTTVYSVGATFIATKKFTCTRCGYVAQGAVAPASCPVCKGTNFVTGNLFQYKSIEVYVNDFGAQRTEGSTKTLIVVPNTQEAKLCLLSQDSGITISEELTLDEGMYSDFTPVSYPPQVYTSHQPWGQNAHYSLVKEMGSPISLKPQLTYFTFTAICGIKLGGIEIHDMDNIGRVNVTIRNIDTNEIETHNDVDCQLVMSSSWGFVTAVSLPKWENVEINFEIFSVEMRT